MSVSKDKKTGKWMCRVSYKDNSGKYKQKTKKGFDTKKEAQVYEVKLMEEVDSEDLEDKNITFADYFEKWFETYKQGKLSRSAEYSYELNIRIVREYFGNTLLKSITRQKYQEFLNWRGKGKSKNTLEKTHFKTQGCLRHAFADGLIDKDPTHSAVLNYDVVTEKKIVSLNLKQTSTLFSKLKENINPKNMILYVALSTGLRAGEVYGLDWSDIDLTAKTLSVRRGFHLNSPFYFTDTKNETSKRTISVTEEFCQMISRYKLKYQKQCPEYLFLTFDKKPIISHNSVNKYLKALCKKLSFPKLTMHQLRHTHCSILLAQGIDIQYVSKRLGHATINETLSTYAHIIDELNQLSNQQAIKKLSALEK